MESTQKVTGRRTFHIQEMCGYWVSPYRSPPVKIFKENRRFYLTMYFRQDRDTTVEITCRIHRYSTLVYIKYFGNLGIVYDRENDQLNIAVEGKYIRENKNNN